MDEATQQFTPLVERPERGRVFSACRRVRLSDADANGRLRLDAIARYLQDVATDDVHETSWGAPDHFWLVRRSLVQQLRPVSIEELVEAKTWASGTGSSSASRRTTLAGDRGGLIEAESVWVHLGPSLRPERMRGGDFDKFYALSTNGRKISPRLELPDPPDDAERSPWPLRLSDLDMMSHLNNATYWKAVEEAASRHAVSLEGPFEAVLEFRQPIDLEDEVELLYSPVAGGGFELALAAGGTIRAVARIRTS